VEAKSFAVLVKEGEAVVRLEESRKGFVGKVSLGLQCTGWLLSMVEVGLLSSVVKDFIKSSRRTQKVLIICRGGNKAGCFLELDRFF
jgi:hypothetical protein